MYSESRLIPDHPPLEHHKRFFSRPACLRTTEDPLPNATTELFIDLITAASFTSLRFLNSHISLRASYLSDAERFFIFAGLFGPFYFSAYTTMLYQNRFRCEDPQFKLYLFVCMALVILMAIYVADCDVVMDGKQQTGQCFSTAQIVDRF